MFIPLRKIISRPRTGLREVNALRYQQAPETDRERLALQLELFNAGWKNIYEYTPYYRSLVETGALPRKVASWEEFLAVFPVVDRPVTYRHLPEMTSSLSPAELSRVTGGSTGSPVQLPAWKSEFKITSGDLWLGRGWYGIEPEDSLFLIWGHRHLLGTGWQGWKNARVRQLKDLVLGYHRYPAYDLSDAAMERAWSELERSGAAYMVGYSVALDRFAQANEGRDFRPRRPLKAVIATAESLPFPDSAERLARVLKTRVAMEYGAVETDLIAHSRPEGGYASFYLNYFIEALERGPSGGYKIRLTSLYPRCFPLLRYEIGDEVETAGPVIGAASFLRVIGRCNDYLRFADGLQVHSEAVTHALSGVSALSGYQMVKEGDRLTLRLTLRKPLGPAEAREIVGRLAKLNPRLGTTRVEVVDTLERSIAGKTPMVINRS